MNGAGSVQLLNAAPQKPQYAPIWRSFVVSGSGPLSCPGPLVPVPVKPVVSLPGGMVVLPLIGPVLNPFAGAWPGPWAVRSSRVQSTTRTIETLDNGPVDGISSCTPVSVACENTPPPLIAQVSAPCGVVEHVSRRTMFPAVS